MIAEVTSATDPRFGPLLALFHAEFPPATREPDEELIAEVEGRSTVPYRYLVWQEPDVRGFVRFARLSSMLFVIHIAVVPSHRNRGIGGRLFEAVRESEPDWPIVCEVDPDEAMDWWVRRGARTVTPTYTQCALRPDTDPVPFHLMAVGPVDDPVRLVETFYREVWGLAPEHPFVVKAVSGIPFHRCRLLAGEPPPLPFPLPEGEGTGRGIRHNVESQIPAEAESSKLCPPPQGGGGAGEGVPPARGESQRRTLRRNHDPNNQERIKRLREHMSVPEQKLWAALRSQRTGFKFRKQHPIGPYILDFYCPEAKLCVEVDGDHHEHTVRRDSARDALLERSGIETLRFAADSVHIDLGHILYRIRTTCESRVAAGLGRPVRRERRTAPGNPPPLPGPEGQHTDLEHRPAPNAVPGGSDEYSSLCPPPQGGGGAGEGVHQPEADNGERIENGGAS